MAESFNKAALKDCELTRCRGVPTAEVAAGVTETPPEAAETVELVDPAVGVDLIITVLGGCALVTVGQLEAVEATG